MSKLGYYLSNSLLYPRFGAMPPHSQKWQIRRKIGEVLRDDGQTRLVLRAFATEPPEDGRTNMRENILSFKRRATTPCLAPIVAHAL